MADFLVETTLAGGNAIRLIQDTKAWGRNIIYNEIGDIRFATPPDRVRDI
jgi:predicted ABC-type ATPase